jgi:predicted exporter
VKDGFLQATRRPARFLPSPATQRARLAALPDAATLATRLAEATEGGPLPAARLARFVDDVQTARKDAPFDRSALEARRSRPAVDALLLPAMRRGPGARCCSLQPVPGQPLDVGARSAPRSPACRARSSSRSSPSSTRSTRATCARRLAGGARRRGGGGAARRCAESARRLAEVLLPIAAATVVVLAALAASGAALGILHLVGCC